MTLRERLQGTDGIRAVAARSADANLCGLSPVECLTERNVITEDFVELYSYTYVRSLMKSGRMKEGEEIVVGWDPRDTEGYHTQAAVRGVRKAGATCVTVGVFSTPGVSFYLQYREAKGAIVVTASHNPRDQNGIKVFLAPLGLKPLPADDAALTSAIYSTPFSQVAPLPPRGRLLDASHEAKEAFLAFLMEPANSWLSHDTGFENTIVVVDCANGAYVPVATALFRRLGFAEVVVVGADPSRGVNNNCGVASLDGCRSVRADGQADTGRDLSAHEAADAILRLAQEHAPALREGELKLAGAVFDADGDRFYRLEFDPWRNLVHVLSGDEVAAHQAAFLASRHPASMRGAVLVTTIESDIALVREAQARGFTPKLTVVGDKWVLLEAARAVLDAAIAASAGMVPEEQRKRWRAAVDRMWLTQDPKCEALCSVCDEIPWADLAPKLQELDSVRFTVGSEESGHTITMGALTTANGVVRPVFIGNGIKSAINTFAATRELARQYERDEYVERVIHPFKPGWKRTLYVYYTDKDKLRRGTELWKDLEQVITKGCSRHFGKEVEVREVAHPHEPALLYTGLYNGGERMRACVFCRNSGTEDKTGIVLRGPDEDAERLGAVGDELRRLLLCRMKAQAHPYARAEDAVLRALFDRGKTTRESLVPLVGSVSVERLLQEMLRQELVEKEQDVYTLTEVGRWYMGSGNVCKSSNLEG